MAVEAPAVPGSKFKGPLITIKAGADADKYETFTVHETLIKDGHDFFRAALDKKWKEGQLREIDLPDDQPEVIGAFVEWLYTQNIAVTPTCQMKREESHEQHVRLAHMYVFGEKIQNTAFRNAVISAILEALDGTKGAGAYNPVTNAVKIIYDGTLPGSTARKLMAYLHVEGGAADWFGKDAKEHHPDFLFDVVQALMKKRDQPGLRCMYEQRADWFLAE
ncbi:unnamed protein product [Zymoseptoria tritici ST99CH_1A5]|uniref:BTB domain-containing protein n=1 Tax=Zymoseptoria tritici ST99CH_1A5 TaxID=1276529 RepID=A0A1Y6LH18_ZYMTR|nr:unnamed protein product [Zymoseptoria tritici ST99CH_1A5]